MLLENTFGGAMKLCGQIHKLKEELSQIDLEMAANKDKGQITVYEEKRKAIGKKLISKQAQLDCCMDIILPKMKSGDL